MSTWIPSAVWSVGWVSRDAPGAMRLAAADQARPLTPPPAMPRPAMLFTSRDNGGDGANLAGDGRSTRPSWSA